MNWSEAMQVQSRETDRFNRQLHQPEKTMAQQIAAAAKNQGLTNSDGSPITAAQIENAMRGANNSQYGEIAATGVVVPLNGNTSAGAVYDTAGMKLVTGSTGNYLVQAPSMLITRSTTLQDLITQNTGGASSPYNWGTSTAQAAAPKIDPYGPFSPTFNTGNYLAGFGTAGRGVAGDYATVNVGSLSGNVTGAVNLYDNSRYVGGSVVMANPSSIAFTPGVSGTVGYILAKTVLKGRETSWLVMECKDSFLFRRPLALTRLERLLTRTADPRRSSSV